MQNMSEIVAMINEKNKPINTVELGEVVSLSPFVIKIGDSIYSSEFFDIWSLRPRKIKEKRRTQVLIDTIPHTEGHTYYKSFDLVHEIDRKHTLEYEVGDKVAVQDNGQSFIILGVVHAIKEVVLP